MITLTESEIAAFCDLVRGSTESVLRGTMAGDSKLAVIARYNLNAYVAFLNGKANLDAIRKLSKTSLL
jgi:hypothetical protein